jgi:hypothetical protein
MIKSIFYLLMLFFIQQASGQILDSQMKRFELFSKNKEAVILYDKNGSSLDSITAYLLSEDILKVTGEKPKVTTDKNEVEGNVIIIGALESDFISSFVKAVDVPNDFRNRKESYLYKILTSPFSASNKALIIAGTDARGTAFGVFDLSAKIGVSPWYFWADVPVQKKEEIIIEQEDFFSKEPSVEFRGIFLNDEDWGLQPWAAKTFEPETGDIGPKTYSKIFELLLRLKANAIWPAMHPSTKAFFYYPGNPEMAEKYHIVVGSSHAEPMLRNNVDEWEKDSMGDFNYLSNEDNVYQYWEERVKQSKDQDAIYTLGIRGIHDSGMEGVKNMEEATQVLSKVLKDQRKLLENNIDKPITEVPQAFTVYKEVLGLYDHGLDLPEDITIMWTDDNYGYTRRLSNEEERARAGGGGVYYHASYWGRPHDYQWLSTTHPGLIREEMVKAYKTNSKKMWILNVGDLKPAEYNMQLFMDMAYNIEKFNDPEYLHEHMTSFYNSIFGKEIGANISDLKSEYYKLAFERKPEFMGWSQTEPTTGIKTTAYDPFSWGDEINTRISKYNKLEKQAEQIKKQIGETSQDAFFQLVYYPIKGASFMNKKFLYRDLSIKYSKQNRLIAKEYRDLSNVYYDSIAFLTHQYNTEIAGGKWKGIMDMAPRKLPVFEKPKIPVHLNENSLEVAGISIENTSEKENLVLPTFYENSVQTHFFDLYLKTPVGVSWSLNKIPAWLTLNKTKGNLSDGMGAQQRILVGIDWDKWRKGKKLKQSDLEVKIGKQKYQLQLKVNTYDLPETNKNIFIEQNGVVAIYAENYSDKADLGELKWQRISGLGYSDNLIQTVPVTEKPLDTLHLQNKSPYLEYSIYTESITNSGELILTALPTHPLTNDHSVRIGVQWNDEPIKIVDFRTYGRSEEWKQNVLRNLARKSVPVKVSRAGEQILKIYMIDEGVALDFIYLKLKDIQLPYSLLPETRI